jgi:hypothetical protein
MKWEERRLEGNEMKESLIPLVWMFIKVEG